MSEHDFQAARRLFPGTQKGIYLNAAMRGLLPTTAVEAAAAVFSGHRDGDAPKEEWVGVVESARERFAALIGAAPTEIAFTKNTAEGLNIVAAGFPWRSGDNVVLCPAIEHPNNIYAWLNLRSRDIEVRTAAARDDAIDEDAVIAAIDDRTRVVTLALVSFTPGYRTPLEKIAEVCRRRGIMLVVDAVQACGALHVDVEALGIDALATANSKGLLGVYGAGFLYVRQSWLERIEPAYLARFSVDQGDAHESEMGGLDFRLLTDARRFEVGHYNFAGIAAVDASLEQILALGSKRVEAHALGLAERLRAGFEARGLPVCRPARPELATHIVTVGKMGGSAYETDDPRLNDLARLLQAEDVRFSVRRGLLRFATHLYNDETDVDRVLDLAGERTRIAAE